MTLLLVCGPWSSGTTAVAGLLKRLGASGFGPLLHTNDTRTFNSFELLPFRDVLLRLASEETLALHENAESRIVPALRAFRDRLMGGEFGPYDTDQAAPIFLKHPLSALMIPEICSVFDTRLIYVVRPFEAIEATRRRRKWPPQYGAMGANAIYARMFSVFVNHQFPTFFLRYPSLLRSPLECARGLAEFSGLPTDPEALKKAAEFIRRPKT